MATWLATVEIAVKADARKEAWRKAANMVAEMEGVVLSIPQKPEPQ